VKGVSASGIGWKLGIRPGAQILSVNGERVRDEIDFRFLVASTPVRVRLWEEGKGEREIRVRRVEGEAWGLEFEPFPVRSCPNRCLFCFVDQLPPGLRPSLYFKDEDYRLSFLHGNYITLTNLGREDWNRIVRQRLSPLYISVHATDPDVRRFLLGNPQAPDIMEQLQRLARARIEMHLQVVICPGLNDGSILLKTIRDLSSLRPYARSLSLVPVGLTSHREGLFPLSPLKKDEAADLVEISERYRRIFRKDGGSSFLYLADEIYLLAESPFPPPLAYDGYPQLENGVGLARRFLSAFARRERMLPGAVEGERHFLVVTGESAFPILRSVADRLNEIRNLRLEVRPLANSLFGNSVTVAGLMSGRDLLSCLREWRGPGEVLVPESALRYRGDAFLDGLSLPEISRLLGRKIHAVRDKDVSHFLRLLLRKGEA